MKSKKKRLLVCALCMAVNFPVFAQKKEEGRRSNSATVLRSIMASGLATSILDRADYVVVLRALSKWSLASVTFQVVVASTETQFRRRLSLLPMVSFILSEQRCEVFFKKHRRSRRRSERN